MKPLSLDLRERIVDAYEAGGVGFSEVGRRFSVSRQVVSKLVRQKQELGTLQPQVHKRGRKPAITGEKKEQLLRHLKEHPDATVVERIETLGLECVEKTAWQTLRGMGWRYKKSPRERPSKTAPT